jgi:hypothetical protein
MTDFYVISLKHTRREDRYITLWKPNDRGYCFRTPNAGRYPEETIRAHLGYYNTGTSIAVPCDIIDAITVMTTPADCLDGPDGPAVLNTRAKWQILLANVIQPALYPPKPQYRGAPKQTEFV